ncbi:hypothetical protein M0L20_15145 [Spirosoma sp. RP8]|uniref:Baseplate protein J-like domain-containing protein n=1 Tax=Spirosoma liriopis TaxID=2937440 RepID=A0ABT0HM05_9BACT|nr:hypothetical protein [Spirosoma liriopis]MCK8493202.1 hypothetical protein [Spirosoma liriopis]
MLDTRDQIKSRMLQQAARLWGYQEAAIDTTAFDPLVDLLVSALATESERVYGEIQASRGRILERLVELLLPEVVTAPRPAHSVMATRPIELVSEVTRTDPFTTRHPQTGDEVSLSPAGRYPIVNGRVACLATGHQLWRVDDTGNSIPVAQASLHRQLPDYTLWLGLELMPGLPEHLSLRFFIDWKNLPLPIYDYAQHLSQTQWWLNDQPLTVQPGTDTVLESGLSPALKTMEGHANRYYRSNFLTVQGRFPAPAPYANGSFIPAEVTDVFDAAYLQALPLLTWIRVDFPTVFRAEIIAKTECVLNAFPVLNRQLGRSVFRLTDGMNVFPIQADLPLIELTDVTDSDGNDYPAYTEVNASDPAARSYAVRRQGVGRFDSRNADEMVRQLMDLLRDESASFAAIGYDTLRSNIEDIQKSLLRIRQSMPVSPAGESAPLLLISNGPDRGNLFVNYWATAAERGNRLPIGARIETSLPAFRREGMALLRPTVGGMARLNPSASLPAFRQALLTRGRALTVEDIRAVCRATAPELIEQVDVQKGYAVSPNPRQGLLRTLDVQVKLRATVRLTAEEQQQLSHELSLVLDDQWTGLLPLRIVLTDPTLR